MQQHIQSLEACLEKNISYCFWPSGTIYILCCGENYANSTPPLDGRKLNIIKSVVNQFAKTAFSLSKEFHIFPSAALSIIVKHYYA